MFNEYNLEKNIFPYKIEEIKYLEGKGNYTIFYFNTGQQKTISYNLLKFQKLLENYKLFIRIHKSYLVNKTLITSIDYSASYLKIITKDALPISKIHYTELKNMKT